MDEQGFEDYKSKYLDLYDKVRTDKSAERVSILEDVDFELELIRRDEINVKYILELITRLKGVDNDKDYEYQYKSIMDLLGGTPELRSKKDLIEKFLENNLEQVQTEEEVKDAFDVYWENERKKALDAICKEEGLDPEKFVHLLDDMTYTGRSPLREDVFGTMLDKPKLLERDTAYTRLSQLVSGFVETFFAGM